MKKYISVLMIAAIMCNLTGCYSSQRDSIDASFDQEKSALDLQCKQNMTEWCKQEYSRINSDYEHEVIEDNNAVASSTRTGIWITVIVLLTGGIVGASVAMECAGRTQCGSDR